MQATSGKVKLLAFIVLALLAASAWALSCREDCKIKYESSVAACEANYGQTDEQDLQERDPKNLQDCIDSAKNTFRDCLDDCKG